MTPQQIDAMKLALEALEGFYEYGYDRQECFEHITAIKEALLEHAMQEVQRLGQEIEQEIEQEPKIGCVNHDCDQCKAQPEQDKLAQDAFDEWWDTQPPLNKTNPCTTDSFEYWAWEGWHAALAQPEQEPHGWYIDGYGAVIGTAEPKSVRVGEWLPWYTAPPQRTEQEPVCDKDPQGCWNVRCQLGKKCKNTPPQRTEQEFFGKWYKGEPPHPYKTEWFIARTKSRERVVLQALPKEFSYDYTTADETYIMGEQITHWMQFPDSSFTDFEQPQRKPLTDDDLSDIWFKQSTDWMEFARAIEAAHDIKETK